MRVLQLITQTFGARVALMWLVGAMVPRAGELVRQSMPSGQLRKLRDPELGNQ
ncbi:hypothetical protein P7K49_009383, partial [Saguinus oedipus]